MTTALCPRCFAPSASARDGLPWCDGCGAAHRYLRAAAIVGEASRRWEAAAGVHHFDNVCYRGREMAERVEDGPWQPAALRVDGDGLLPVSALRRGPGTGRR